MALTTDSEIQLLPAGRFYGRDGRPTDAPGWFLDAALAQVLIAAASVRNTPYVIDYEHQTLLAKENGKPAPAAGWFKSLEWRDGVGLFAVDVEWTTPAQEFIATKQYRFISPVIGYDRPTGAVTALFMAAATNNPAIDGMDSVLLAAAALHFTFPTASLTQELPMDELLEQLRWLLNMPVGSTATDVQAQLKKLLDLIKEDSTAAAAATFDLPALIVAHRVAVASLSSAVPDPSKYVPIAAMVGLQQKVAQLTAQGNLSELDSTVKAALAAGKLVPAQEEWARALGGQNMAALTGYLATAPEIVTLNTTQTKSVPPSKVLNASGLTENQVALCAALGVEQDEFLKTYQATAQV